MTRRDLLAMVAATAVLGQRAFAQATQIDVLKDPGCGCCDGWAKHLRDAGFRVTVAESADMAAEKDRRGIPARVRSCHTGVVNGYVLEGHVPAAAVQKLLKERPAVVGIGVPGMPIGSPGMEVGKKKEPYEVLLLKEDGTTEVYAKH